MALRLCLHHQRRVHSRLIVSPRHATTPNNSNNSSLIALKQDNNRCKSNSSRTITTLWACHKELIRRLISCRTKVHYRPGPQLKTCSYSRPASVPSLTRSWRPCRTVSSSGSSSPTKTSCCSSRRCSRTCAKTCGSVDSSASIS